MPAKDERNRYPEQLYHVSISLVPWRGVLVSDQGSQDTVPLEQPGNT